MKPFITCSPLLATLSLFVAVTLRAQSVPADDLRHQVTAQIPGLFEIYTNFHLHPELSLHEANTSARIATELQNAGFTTTTHVGGFGVVGVLTNGDGPRLLIRTDMDALPVKEETGLPYASTVTTLDDTGAKVGVMHACGHDIHMSTFIGVARLMAANKGWWHGTLIMIGQPAEERGGGAKNMLADGLFERFPKPQLCLAFHDAADLPAGEISVTPGYIAANVNSVEIIVRGVGGHGAYPHKTKDPIVLAAEIIVELQTIVSREVRPGEPCVVTVGSIHGGTKNNIIPGEVKMELTVRTYSDEVRKHVLASIARISRGCAIAAGLPDDLMPIVNDGIDFTPSVYNDPDLSARVRNTLTMWFGATNIVSLPPGTGGEDFSRYGRTGDKIPICMFNVGAVNPQVFADSVKNQTTLPSLHSPLFAPDPLPTLQTAVTAMTATALDVLGGK